MSDERPRHRVLVIGVGSIGERHLRCFGGSGRAEVSFVEPNPSLREVVARRYPAARARVDLEAALAAGVDAAVIATPAPLHVPLATRLAAAGVHVLIEKPLGVTTDGVQALAETVAGNGTVAAVAYVYRVHPALADMQAAIAAGRLGRPLEVVAVAGQHFPTYRPDYHATYYASHDTGGGAVQDALTHVINAAEWLVGPIEQLVADAGHLALDGVDVEDTVHVIARHGPVLGSYSLNQHQAPNELTLTVVCQNATARFEYHACRWRSMTEPGAQWADHAFGPLDRDELFIRQADAFLDAIESGGRMPCTLDDAAATLRVNEAVLRSVESRTWQDVGRPTIGAKR